MLRRTLCDQFAVSTLSGFGIDHVPSPKLAAAALIHYAKETQKTALPHIRSHSARTRADTLLH